tara:strand:+ start:206 stop:394 length:189 start_codon:yes stop_codon:yes gene_type:complete
MNYQNIAIAVFVSILVFVVIREVVCWYFKINERIALQQKVLVNQKRVIDQLTLINLNIKGVK